MFHRLREESPWLFRSWWCRGHGAAVLAMVVLAVIVPHHGWVVWAGVGFLLGHTMMAIHRYRLERRIRVSITLSVDHPSVASQDRLPLCFLPIPIRTSSPSLSFDPLPVNSMVNLHLNQHTQ